MFEYEFGCVDMLTEGNTLENFCPQHPNKSKLSATAYSQCCNNTNLCNYDLLFDPPSPLSLTPSAMATPSVGELKVCACVTECECATHVCGVWL